MKNQTTTRINRLCIIGVGLIGGSLARAVRGAGVCNDIVGCGRSAENLERAQRLGVIDHSETDIARAVKDADVVFVAVPMGAMEAVFAAMNGHLGEDTVVTDAGSAKQSVIRAARSIFGPEPGFLVPGHPIAGTEKSGVQASFATLFNDRRVILTPLPETRPEALSLVRGMWQAAGAEVLEMDAQRHDEVLAATSHLPHMLAFALVDALARRPERDEIFDFAAGGFRDFTRIASSDPVMWRDICLANRDALLTVMDRFQQDLTELRTAIDEGAGERVLEIFQRAKQARDRFTR